MRYVFRELSSIKRFISRAVRVAYKPEIFVWITSVSLLRDTFVHNYSDAMLENRLFVRVFRFYFGSSVYSPYYEN